MSHILLPKYKHTKFQVPRVTTMYLTVPSKTPSERRVMSKSGPSSAEVDHMRLGRVLLLIGSLKSGFLRRASKNELRLQICVNGVPKIDQLFHTFFKKC